MKIIYIATAHTVDGDAIQENAYENAEQALEQAVLMCKDINAHTQMNARPDAVPFELYEQGDVVPEPPISSE